jgi:hypothetical protein
MPFFPFFDNRKGGIDMPERSPADENKRCHLNHLLILADI